MSITIVGVKTDYTIICDGGNAWTGQYQLETRDGRRARQNVTLKSEDSPHTAEYKALIAGLLDLTARITAANKDTKNFTVHILTKSQLVVEQLAGRYEVKSSILQFLHTRTHRLLKQFKRADLTKTSRTAIKTALTH